MFDDPSGREAGTAPPTVGPQVTVVVPTRGEADNIDPLVARLDVALADVPAEILFVDDSDDTTPAAIGRAAETARAAVRLVHRAPGERSGGLGTAVLTGLRRARAPWVVVMDADLQHPPELAAELVRTGEATGSDVVVASRYVDGGSASGLSSVARGWVSRSTTRLSKLAFPRRLADCSDPMSGCFAVRPSSLDLDRMRPRGFKILLEILARSQHLRVAEVGYTFGERNAGTSKASWREGALFLRRLGELRVSTAFGRHADRAASIAGFSAAGATGIAVNSALLWLLVTVLHSPLLLAACLATQGSTLWNFVLIDRLVYRGDKSRRSWQRLLGFAAVNNAVLLLRLPLLDWLAHSVGMHYLLANVITLLAAFHVRYLVSDRYLFTRGGTMTTSPVDTHDLEPHAAPPLELVPARRGSRRDGIERTGPVDLVVDLTEPTEPLVRRHPTTLRYGYDIHGLVTIRSAVRLPELEFFAAPVAARADIEIAPGVLLTGRPRRRTRVTQYAALPAVAYQEHLGRAGSDVFLDMTDGIRITAGPVLMRSPHVLYTNVVEALLRFVLVTRGHMLLHSACLDFDGHGVLLSALTDTGKTGTVLRLLREQGGRFLSDDMTIVDTEGRALCYPKPLTISHHTLRAVNAGELSRREWRRLKVQSRIHSKQGRGIGARLGEMNLPIMSVNAMTQLVVPPPKYAVDRLVRCRHGRAVELESLFVIERAPFHLDDIAADSLVDELIANTDDAYGFPPFRYLAPAFVVGGEPYEELRARERAILAAAMRQVRARRLATPDFTWADHIPALVRDYAVLDVTPDLDADSAARGA